MKGLVSSYAGLATVRFFLGLVEGPLYPAIVLYLSGFYTRKELSLRYVSSVASGNRYGFLTLSFAASPYFSLLRRYADWFGDAKKVLNVKQLSGAFSGFLAAAIQNMDGIGGRPGWAWIFILVSADALPATFMY